MNIACFFCAIWFGGGGGMQVEGLNWLKTEKGHSPADERPFSPLVEVKLYFAAAASSTAGPLICSIILASNSSISSGLSFINDLTASLPWPSLVSP